MQEPIEKIEPIEIVDFGDAMVETKDPGIWPSYDCLYGAGHVHC